MVYVLLLALALVYSWFAGGLRSFTTASLVAVAIPIAVLAIAAVRVPRAATPATLTRAALLWLVPLLAFGVLEGLSLLVWHSSYEHPSVSVLLDRPLDSHPVRSLAVFGWLTTGWWVIRR
jgi:hypothetical protein